MNKEETRQLGIEFERRCQTFDPSFQSIGKLDTEDIYSFLNQYQLQFVKQLYAAQDSVLSGTNASNRIRDYLKSLYTTTNVQLSKAISDSFYVGDMSKQASDYFMYESSKTFFGTPMVDISSLSNVLVDIRTLESVQDGTYDKHRIIRKPLLAIKNNTALVYSSENEKYPPKYLRLTYIRKPAEFKILGDNPTDCELPIDCFEDLVTGAVELFFNYKYKVFLAQQTAKARAKKNKEDKEDDDD